MRSAEQIKAQDYISQSLRTPAIDAEDLRNKIFQSIGHAFKTEDKQEINAHLLQYFLDKEYTKKMTVEISTQTVDSHQEVT